MNLIYEIQMMLEKAQKDYDDAARMHAMGKVSYAGGQIKALKSVLCLLIGTTS